MPLVFSEGLVCFEAVCTVEDALPLLDRLRAEPAVQIDLAACTALHTALLQVLLLARPHITAPPVELFLARWVAPLLTLSSSEI